AESITVPHIAMGGGWSTELILVNPTGAFLNGTLIFRDPGGRPISVAIDGVVASNSTYTVQPMSSLRLRLTDPSSSVRSGWVGIVPGATDAPAAMAVFQYQQSGITLTQAGAAAVQGTSPSLFETYVQVCCDVRAGLAIANPSLDNEGVSLELRNLDGTPT